MKIRLIVLGIVLGLFTIVPVASASPIGVVWEGGVFTLDLTNVNATSTEFTVLYRADLTAFTGASLQQDYIFGVGLMPTPSNIFAFSGSSGYGWYFRADELSAGGCRNGNDSFACASTWNGSALQPIAQLATGVLSWEFVLHYAAPVENFTLEGISIKAAFSSDNTGATQAGLMSETTSQVPDPASTLLLLGTSLAGLAAFARRTRR